MGQLRALQEELKTILPIGSEKTKSSFWPEGLPNRLQVYKNTVHGNAFETLDLDFPLTKKQFSTKDWDALSEKFFKKYPPSFWELNGCIHLFPKFLKSLKVKAVINELAQYELTDLLTFIHTAVVRKLSGKSNPTISIQLFQFAILGWVEKKCPPESAPRQKPEVVLFYRDTKHDCHIRKGDPLTLLMLDHFKKPGAQLKDLESARAKLLPDNSVPLQSILDKLIKDDLILR